MPEPILRAESKGWTATKPIASKTEIIYTADLCVVVDVQKLLEFKGGAAIKSKTHRTTLAHGAVIVEALNIRQEVREKK